ncbi:aminoglycoside phosphotransferase family protein [Sphingomonas gellani]|nr:phosphotransferase [Sphingomonas gellani]
MTPPAGAAGFLAAHGWAGARIDPLTGDASFRRYFRITQDGRSAMLMDAPPPRENPRAFLDMAQWLGERGFAAPRIHAADADAGLVLLQDFGNDRMREAADANEAAVLPLYESAVDTLVQLRTHAPGALQPYDRAFLQREVGLFVEWYCPAVSLSVDSDGWHAAWDEVLGHGLSDAPVTVLRDYHAENLMLRGTGEPLGLLDFQDALAGHPAYDLVSLLQDARRDVDPNVEEAMLARYLAATGDGDAFMRSYHVLGAQRNAKVIGLFTRLWQRDGKPRYPTMCPRVWAYLERDLSFPVLAPIEAWMERNVPPELRGDPMVLAG